MKKKQNNSISYGKQYIDREDINSVNKVLKSQFLTQGPYVEKFENNLKKITLSKYAVSANSATSCLMLACRALELKKNDLVWTSPITFVSTANSAIHCGAKVDLVDIDLETGNISSVGILFSILCSQPLLFSFTFFEKIKLDGYLFHLAFS